MSPCWACGVLRIATPEIIISATTLLRPRRCFLPHACDRHQQRRSLVKRLLCSSGYCATIRVILVRCIVKIKNIVQIQSFTALAM
jgi:hypothetical protein